MSAASDRAGAAGTTGDRSTVGPGDAGSSTPRLASIDVLRGLAILGVIVVHNGYCWVAGVPSWVRGWSSYGRYGVDLFFIVSAYTLVGTYARRTWQDFAVRRWLRLAPVYYLGIALYGFGPWVVGEVGAPDARVVAANLTLVNGWWPGQASGLVPGGWSISAEAAFYLVLPFLGRALTSLPRALLAYAASVFAAQWLGAWATEHWARAHFTKDAAFDFANYAPVWFVPTFVLGIVLYHAVPRVSRRVAVFSGILGLVSLLAVFRLSGILPRSVAAGMPLFLIALGVAGGRWDFSSWWARWLRFTGKVSFSIYLLHFAVLDALIVLVVFAGGDRTWPGWLNLLATLLGTIVASLAAAAVSFRFVEQPAMNLANRIAVRRGWRKVAPPTAS